ncbi:MAG: glutamine--scyllo-inositol transaminase [Parcubacteria group bacterium Gr01-1014_30]|nr:MAG: glutamine--scyllo-inositol transaminase [Parcubacteria group bacterium Gr01-1014_30]
MEYRINFINNSYRRFAKAHKEELISAFWDCLERGALTLREEVSKFEDNLANFVGTKYAIGVNSGTDALFLSCKALGIKGNWNYLLERVYAGEITIDEANKLFEGDELITVSHTFIASIQCIVNCGAKPVLVDVGENELMNPELIEPAITERTKAILPVHFHGKVCDMDAILDIAAKHNLHIIEDAAQALGSSYKGKMAGSFGDAGCFSFNTAKLLGGFGDGGGIVTNSRDLCEKLYLLRNHWNMAQTSVRMSDFPTPEIVQWAWKSRLDNVQAALLNVKFKYYRDLLVRRKQIADMYCEGLKGLPLKLPKYGEGDVIQEFIVRIGNEEEREKFKKFMDEKGIEVLIRETTPNHKVKNLYLDHFSLPVTESISKDAVRLPTYPELEDSEVDEIIGAIREFYK